MKENLIKTIDLENNLQMNLYDASRKLAGDRWLVSMVVRMKIPVTEVLFNDDHSSAENVDKIKKVLGESVLFEQKRERIFIDEKEKDAVFTEMYETFMDSVFQYLSQRSFPKKYVMKIYREEEKKRSWYQQ